MKKVKKIISAVLSLTMMASALSAGFVGVSAAGSFEAELAQFPTSYRPQLQALHEKYPEWHFKALKTGVTLDAAVQGEMGDAHKNNTIQNSAANISAEYLCQCEHCYQDGAYIPKEGKTWMGASEKAVSFYLDPRNFLDEKNIFQFENLSYNDEYQNETGVNAILKGTFMADSEILYKDASGTQHSEGMTYAQAIMDAAKTSGVSPYYLASKIRQEIGLTPSASVSGTTSGYEGIYNFYNIGAYSGAIDGLKWAAATTVVSTSGSVLNVRPTPSTENQTIGKLNNGDPLIITGESGEWYQIDYNGTTGYVMKKFVGGPTWGRPWNTPVKSIANGASWIGNSYITQGQNTGYLQKFNVNPDSVYDMYTHQYMTNVQAAASEGVSTYTGYKDIGTLADSKMFIIPVYEDMPYGITLNIYDIPSGFHAGETYKITAISSVPFTWESEDDSIVTIEQNGVMTAHKVGETAVTAKTADGDSATCRVVISAPPLSLNITDIPSGFNVGETYKITAYSNLPIVWSSQDTAIVTIEPNGVMTAHKAGETTVSASDGYSTVSCRVVVTGPSVSLNITDIPSGFHVGETYKITAASNVPFTWESADDSIVTIEQNGVMTAHKTGETYVTARTKYGTYASCRVVISAPALSLNITDIPTGFNVGETYKIMAYSNLPIVWSSQDTAIVTIEPNGVMTAHKAGETTVSASDGYSTVSCRVVVTGPSVSLNITDIPSGFHVGETYKITAASNVPFTWESADDSIVTIEQNGVMTGHKTGETYVTARTEYGTYASCRVVISAPALSLNITDIPTGFNVGETYKIMAYSNLPIVWASQDDSIVTIEQNGVMTAHKAGETTVSASDGYSTVSCRVVVTGPSVSLNITDIPSGFHVGETYKITAASNVPFTWESADDSIVTIEQNGVMTGHKTGETYVTARTEYGTYASCRVVISAPALSLNITDIPTGFNVGETYKIMAYSNLPIVWASQDDSIVTIEQNGVMTAHKAGETTVSASDGYSTVSCRVVVTGPSVSLNITDIPSGFHVGETYKITAASNVPFTWESADDSIVTIEQNGVMTGHKIGETYVTARTEYGTYASCRVVISAPALSLNITDIPSGFNIGETYKITAYSNLPIVWASQDDSIVTIEQNGVMTAHKAGETTVSASDGYSTVSCRVVVTGPSVSLNITDIPSGFHVGETYKITAASNVPFTWESADDSIVTIAQNGVMTAHKIGETYVTARTEYGTYASCHVVVRDFSLELSIYDITDLFVGDTYRIRAYTNKPVVWVTSNPNVAAIDKNGIVTATGAGQTTAIATIWDESMENILALASCNLTVASNELSLNANEVRLNHGQTFQLEASQEATAYYFDENIAYVDDYGIIHAGSFSGTTTIMATYRGTTTACNVFVGSGAGSLNLSTTHITINPGETYRLTANLGNVMWAAQDPTVSVNENGVVTANMPGTTVVLAYTDTQTIACIVEVRAPAPHSITTTRIDNLPIGQTYKLTASENNVQWLTGDSRVIDIDENGVITAVGSGKATVLAHFEDGTIMSCTVFVS